MARLVALRWRFTLARQTRVTGLARSACVEKALASAAFFTRGR